MQSMMSIQQQSWEWENFQSNYRCVFSNPEAPTKSSNVEENTLLSLCANKVGKAIITYDVFYIP